MLRIITGLFRWLFAPRRFAYADTFVLVDADVLVNAVDLSTRVKSVTVKIAASDEDFTAMGATGKARKAGLRDDSFEIEFNQDFASGSVDATMFPLVGAAPFAVKVRGTSSSVSATNPSYEGNAILTDFNPIDGAVGSPLVVSVSLPVDGIITRVTA